MRTIKQPNAIHASKSKGLLKLTNQKQVMISWRRHWIDFAFIVFLSSCSLFTTSFFFFKDTSLYWDTAQHFVQFRDNLHSINYFGEIAYWFPQNQFGWPSYYYSILGFPHGASPIFGAVAFVCWILGRLGIIIQEYHPIYVLYFGFITPMVFLFSVYSFVLHFLKSKAATWFALILAAFSPGVMVNVTDIGFLEPLAYSLMLGAAFLSILKRPCFFSYLKLCLVTALLGISFNYSFLFWNLVIIPLFCITIIALAGRDRQRIFDSIRTIEIKKWALLGILFVICALPNLAAYQATGELIKPALEGKAYRFEDLKSGNPLAVFSASLPGFGFDWAPSYREHWSLIAKKDPGVHVGYYYMGLLCVPLMIYSCFFARNPIRIHFLLILLLTFGIINLSGYSPFFAWLLALPTPLRSVNHYSDLLFRSGAFFVLLFGAALGLDTLLKTSHSFKRPILKIFSLIVVAGLILFAVVYGEQTLRSASFGFSLFIGFIILVLLWGLVHTNKSYERSLLANLLLFAVLLDVSTQTFLHVRKVIHGSAGYRLIVEEPSPSKIGLTISSDPYFFTNFVLVYRSLSRMATEGFNFDQIAPFKLFTHAHVNEDMASERQSMETLGFTNQYHSICLSPEARNIPEFKPFLEKTNPSAASGSIHILKHTYNTLVIGLETSEPSIIFIKDSYSRYWNAKINGQNAPVARALYNFKAVPVPAGVSTLTLQFSPTGVGPSLFVAYFLLCGLTIWMGILWFRNRRLINESVIHFSS